MKARALTVYWHNETSPVYSLDFQPGHRHIRRLATAGGDNNVRIWRVTQTTPVDFPQVHYLATLAKHTQAVNVVRFDPKGEFLASAGDDGNVLIWMAAEEAVKPEFGTTPDPDAVESWKLLHSCRTSSAEVYDLAWSPDSQFLLTGSMDNIARIFNASNGQHIRNIAEHSHYVQGVTWDPLGEYIATQSSDRSVHIYSLRAKDGQLSLNTTPFYHHKVSKHEAHVRRISSPSPSATEQSSASPSMQQSDCFSAPGTPSFASVSSTSNQMNPPSLTSSTTAHSHSRKSSFGSSSSVRRSASPTPPSVPLPAVLQVDSPKATNRLSFLYHAESLNTFYRRLTFSTDGSLLLTPSGFYKHNELGSNKKDGENDVTNTVFIYTRAGLNRPPVLQLPGMKKPSIAVKCSPIFYQLRGVYQPTGRLSIDKTKGEFPAPKLEKLDPKAKSDNSSNGASPMFNLPYRMIIGVATQDSVHVYDTQQQTPLCIVSNLHYATFTDLSWSDDGNILFMSSTDGFCSALQFDPGDLGEPCIDQNISKLLPQQTKQAATTTFDPVKTGTDIAYRHPGGTQLQAAARHVGSPVGNFELATATQLEAATLDGITEIASPDPSNSLTPIISPLPTLVSYGGGPDSRTPPQTPRLSAATTTSTNTAQRHQSTLTFPASSGDESESQISGKRFSKLSESNGSQQSDNEGEPKKKRRIAPTFISKE